MSRHDITEAEAKALDDLADKIDWPALARTEQERADLAAESVAAMLADGYRKLHRDGKITQAELAAKLDELADDEGAAP